MKKLFAPIIIAVLMVLGVILISPRPTNAETNPSNVTVARSSDTPIILLVDVSGSMSASGGNNQTRLEGAKAGMKSAIDPSNGNMVGIWTYPGDGNCSAGGYVWGAEPQKRSDVAMLNSVIDGLSANGNTPTSQALAALGDSLEAEGYKEANIILVSDGESNCSPPKPPCEVARDLNARGFDITINTIGFDISNAGRDELTCIANQTNGRYVDVSNAEQLSKEIAQQSTPVLEVEARATPSIIEPGGHVELTVTATNKSNQQDIEDACFTLSFVDDGDTTVFPPVVPPRTCVGNIPRGQSISRTWGLSFTGVQKKDLDAKYRAVVYYKVDGAYKEGRISIRLGSGDKTWEKKLGIDGHDQIVIMGDSYSSGEGSRDYYKKDDGSEDWCHRSKNSYIQSSYNVVNLACSGAVAEDFRSTQYRNEDSEDKEPVNAAQLGQLMQLETTPKVVFLTLGGNDIDFAKVVTCFAHSATVGSLPGIAQSIAGEEPCDWEELSEKTLRNIASLDLARTYNEVYDTVNSEKFHGTKAENRESDEITPVIVLPYINLLSENDSSCYFFKNLKFTPEQVRTMNQLQKALNDKIQEEVFMVGNRAIFFAAGVEKASAQHSLCDNSDGSYSQEKTKLYINGIIKSKYMDINLNDSIAQAQELADNPVIWQESFHPSQAGYDAQNSMLQRYISSDDFNFGRDKKKWSVRPISYQITDSNGDIEPINFGTISEDGYEFAMGRLVKVRVSDLKPYSSGVLAMYSHRIALASYRADADGKAVISFYVPMHVPAGEHKLVVEGIGPNGKMVELAQTIHVKSPIPWWMWALVALAGLFVIATVVLFVAKKRAKSAVGKPKQAKCVESIAKK